jgi:hypothetical protein
MKPPSGPVRMVALLSVLAVVAGVVLAGMAFPLAAGFGLVVNQAGEA